MEHKLYLFGKKKNIMATIDLRNTVKDYVKTADGSFKMMRALAETYQNYEQESP